MKRSMKWFGVLILTAVVASTGGSFLAQQTNSALVKDEVALRAAMEKETVQGDLKGAIEQYKKIAQSKDRSIAARAIIRMAECYQKLGDTESRSLYERIVREFGDQKEAVALAQARLSGATAGTKGDRAVWTGPKVDTFGRVSADGRFITYVDWNNGSLMIRDLASGMDRVLTPGGPDYVQYAAWSVISSDGKQVAYVWHQSDLGPDLLRLATLQGSGFLQPREVFRPGCSLDPCPSIGSLDLSADRKWIAAVIHLKDERYQIALIAVADGSSRILNSMDGPRSPFPHNTLLPHNIFFSPDSKYIAYDLPANDRSKTQPRDVFVLPIDGSSGVAAVAHDAKSIMGWSPDGTRLLYSSERFGSVGLFALPFADGKVQGPPEFLKPDIGPGASLGVTASGALYVAKGINTRDIAIAPIDLSAGRLLGPPVSFSQGFVENPGPPFWSPDGKYLAYQVNSCNQGCIAIRSVATGQVRRVAYNLTNARAVHWSPNGRSLLTKGADQSGREGILQIDVQSGEATTVILGDGLSTLAQWSPDGKKVYFNFNPTGRYVERDLASGAERDFYREVGVRNGSLSPDGRYLQVLRKDSSTKAASLLLVPIDGGAPRELLRVTEPEALASVNVWTPDSSGVIVTKDTGSRIELWLVPVTGGRPRKLDIDTNLWQDGSNSELLSGFTLSPDGRSIALQMGKTVNEVWALENFLPKAAAKR